VAKKLGICCSLPPALCPIRAPNFPTICLPVAKGAIVTRHLQKYKNDERGYVTQDHAVAQFYYKELIKVQHK